MSGAAGMEQWLQDPNKIGAYVLLLLMVGAFFRGWIVTGAQHDRVIKERDRYLEGWIRSNELLARGSIAGVEIAKSQLAASIEFPPRPTGTSGGGG